jgi:hypothetical protein
VQAGTIVAQHESQSRGICQTDEHSRYPERVLEEKACTEAKEEQRCNCSNRSERPRECDAGHDRPAESRPAIGHHHEPQVGKRPVGLRQQRFDPGSQWRVHRQYGARATNKPGMEPAVTPCGRERRAVVPTALRPRPPAVGWRDPEPLRLAPAGACPWPYFGALTGARETAEGLHSPQEGRPPWHRHLHPRTNRFLRRQRRLRGAVVRRRRPLGGRHRRTAHGPDSGQARAPIADSPTLTGWPSLGRVGGHPGPG